MKNLPIVTAKVTVYNQKWVRGTGVELFVQEERECEVVQLNLNSGGMRVRFTDYDVTNNNKPCVKSYDVPISNFFDKYSIVANG